MRPKKVREKISKKLNGRKLSESHKKNIGKQMKGRKRPPFSEKWKRKISETRIRRKVAAGKNNPMFGKKGKEAPFYGKHHTKESKNRMKKSLRTHHIYLKENNDETNLITLCHECNMIVNHNKDYWFAYFSYIMENVK